jgi:hypothetical protein
MQLVAKVINCIPSEKTVRKQTKENCTFKRGKVKNKTHQRSRSTDDLALKVVLGSMARALELVLSLTSQRRKISQSSPGV